MEETVVARDLMSALARGPLVCDGAMGTMLLSSGVACRCPEELNVTSPGTVRMVHEAYVAAGASIIETNSFGGSRLKMTKAGLPDLVDAANLAAARIARDAAGETVFVAGSIGPLGEFLEPLGELTREEAVAIFRQQAKALAEGGVDFFIVETMYDLGEAVAAVEGARTAGLPVMATMTFDTNGRTMMGVLPSRALAELRTAGAFAVGANCGVGPAETLQAIEEMHEAAPGVWLAAQPNAGIPETVDGKTVYSVGPSEMAGWTGRFLHSGVKILGTCCGSSPAYTTAIVQAIRGA
jgi:5-methyltetrahydrofolate--homocysteine methyltransferase